MDEKPAINQAASTPRPPTTEADMVSPSRRGLGLRTIIGILVAIIVIAATLFYYIRYAAPYETTDDAFIDSYTTFVSPRVAGPITKLLVTDNQHVKAGDVLVEIDPRDFQVAVEQAKADLATANSRIRQAETLVIVDQAKAEQQKANVVAAQAVADRAKADLERYQALQTQSVSRSQIDESKQAANTGSAQVDVAANQAKAAVAQVDSDRADVETARAQVQQAQTRLDQAQLQLSYAKVVAPRDGRVTKRSVELGAYVQTGQALLALVPDEVWVVANFKETQLEYMRPGQPVTIHLDMYPHHEFKGKVDSLQAGSGAAFSLLPPENAVGNYVKVVQRLPVKIVFDEPVDPAQFLLGPGMSVQPKVRVK